MIDDERQQSYYIRGIGTGRGSLIRRVVDSAIAITFEDNILSAYTWLCNTYRPGDRIFLFGFSRGAYQVRLIAGMIDAVGLLSSTYINEVRSALKSYMKTVKHSSSSRPPSAKFLKAKEECQALRSFTYGGVKVYFVGVWDTVSSIGISGGPTLPEPTGMSHVCYFRHELALDERRVRFWPEHANEYTKSFGDVKEVWFAGSHSDVGGWSPPNRNLDVFGPALRWMILEATNSGLRIHQHTTRRWTLTCPTKSSLNGFWHILEYLPIRRRSYNHGISRRPHNGAPRQIQPGQHLHRSVFEAMGADFIDSFNPETSRRRTYQPLAHFGGGTSRTWNDINSLITERLEDDPLSSASSAMENLGRAIYSEDVSFYAAIHVLNSHVFKLFAQRRSANTRYSLGHGPKLLAVPMDASVTLFSALEREVERGDSGSAEVIGILISALAIVPPNRHAQLDSFMLRQIAAAVQDDAFRPLYPEFMQSYRQVVQQYGNSIGPLHKISACHCDAVKSVAFSNNNGDMIFTGSYDAVVIRDNEAKISKATLSFGDYGSVRSVEMSGDGTRCVSGHGDGSARWWDVENGILLRTLKPEGSTNELRTVALSSSMAMIASGSVGGIIRMWATETGEDLYGHIDGHMSCINKVAFSPDGSRLVSSSDDCTIRLWDTSNGQGLGVIEGYTSIINSVAFSPCGKSIVSASMDKTVCILDRSSDSARWVLKKLEGHTDIVWCASCSTNQKFVVSCSDDGTLRVWDLSSGETLFVYNVGTAVSAVAFSDDGQKIISGCFNGDVYVWDASYLL